MTPFATDITARYRHDVAAETAELDAEIHRLEDEVRAATGALHAAENRRATIIARHDAALFVALHVKLDADGCPVARQGKPTKAAQAARGAAGTEPPADPPAPDVAPETPTTGSGADAGDGSRIVDVPHLPGVGEVAAAVADDRTPAQVRLVLSDLDWAVDEMNQYSDTALAYAAKHGLKPSDVTRTDDGGMQIGVDGAVIP